MEPSDKEKRLVIKFFWQQAGCPPEEQWSGVGGTISWIRWKMGEAVPCMLTVRRTLLRLAEGETDCRNMALYQANLPTHQYPRYFWMPLWPSWSTVSL